MVVGLGQGAGISLAFALMVLRAKDDHVAAGLSGFVQTGGYLIAAATPVLVGVAYDASGGWQLPLLLLAAFASCSPAAGWWPGPAAPSADPGSLRNARDPAARGRGRSAP